MDFDKLKKFILSWEGGFVNDPRDSGGATNKGITLSTFRSVYGKNKTVKDLKTITDALWTYIYKTRFWDRYKADNILDSSIKFLLVDWLWNSGVAAITKVLQYLGTKTDGIVGGKTLSLLNTNKPKEMFNNLWHLRETYYRTRAKFPIYGKGWLKRLNSIQYGKLIANNGTIL